MLRYYFQIALEIANMQKQTLEFSHYQKLLKFTVSQNEIIQEESQGIQW